VSTSGTVDSNGVRIHFEVHGAGPPLVLLMGIGFDSSLWTLAQVPALSQRFQVILVDNRDAGRSSRAEAPYTIADMADDTARVLDALGVERAHVLGLSMGGMIAQQLALRHGARLDHLILTGCGAAPARAAFDPIRAWSWIKAHDPSGETFACEQLTWLFSTQFLRNRAGVKQTLAMLSSNPHPIDAAAYGRQARAYLEYDALDRLQGIEAPTLVIVGEQDLLTPPHVCREVAAKIPGARFEQIAGPGSSHAVPLERPDDFNALVTRFLS
jgi:3-oxoadipate enol-lactonase